MLPHEFSSDGCYKTDGVTRKECQNSFLINILNLAMIQLRLLVGYCNRLDDNDTVIKYLSIIIIIS